MVACKSGTSINDTDAPMRNSISLKG